MHKQLLKIIDAKKQEVKKLKREGINFKDNDLPPARDFRKALSKPGGVNLIAEIKFASPSAGLIREKTDASAIGQIYERAGAAAISLLTDKQFFGGDLDTLPRLKKAVSIPILRKDFIIDEHQVQEAFKYGSDAILLIVRILTKQQLSDLLELSFELGLSSLVEVHDKNDLDIALECGANIIGINNRDLDSFKVDMNNTFLIAPFIPKDCVIVCESGIESGNDIRRLLDNNINAALVGSSIMKSADPGAKVRELVDAGKIQ